jgi:hypothetical protein
MRDCHQLDWKTIGRRLGYADGKWVKELYWRRAEKGMRDGSKRSAGL